MATSPEVRPDTRPMRPARWNPRALRLAVALLLLLSIAWAAPSRAAGNTPIFVLHSYSQEYPWTKRQHEGFLRQLGAAVPDTIAASVEYLDTKRVPYTAAYAAFVAAHLAQKYAGFEPKLIYVTDDNALLFALSHLTRIFPGTPVFFSGINDYDMKQRIDPRQVTGVFENKEIAPNLDLMRHLAPGVREILVVGDESETFQAIQREVAAALSRQPDIRAQFLSTGRIEWLVTSLRARKEQVIFLTTLGAMTDDAGRTLTLPETIAAIVQAGRFIVISMEDVYLYPGVLGGYVTSGTRQGAAAAEMSARYLSGTAVAAIKPIEISPNEYIFDGAELEKLGLALPPGLAGRTTILNPLPTFYERHVDLVVRSLYALALLFLVSIAASIYVLVRKNRQIARTSRDLAAQTGLMSDVQESLVRAQRIARMGNWDWHIQDKVLYWSEGIYKLFGIERGAVAVSYDALLARVHPQDRQLVGAAVRAALDRRSAYDLRHRIVLPDGAVRVVHQSGEVIRDAAGRPQRMIATMIDVTEQTQAEQALRESEDKLRTVIEGLPVVLWAIDRAGVFTFSRGAGLKALGLAPDEVVGQSLFELYRDSPAIIADARRALLGENHVSSIWVGDLAFETHYTPLCDRNGAIIGATGVSTDVTKRKRIEEAHAVLEAHLRESQKMEAIGTLAGGIAHDFNNILGTILGNADLARQDCAGNPPALESLEEIRKAGHRARNLVQQILSFGRRQPTVHRLVALAPVCAESVRLLRSTLPARVRIEYACAGAESLAIPADATQVEQVLLNLCTNAAQAMQGHPGTITIRVESITLDEAAARMHADLGPGRYARITIADTGHGIDAQTMTRIFEPFFTTKAVDEGSGLGLSVVHGIMRTHKGAVTVKSEPGQGATFELYFPGAQEAAGVAAAEEVAATGRAGETNGRHILYIDDDESLVYLVKRMLERRGYRVSGYNDPHDGLEALRADPASFDLALTDYNMPGLSGLDVARCAFEIRPDLPLAMASGYITDEMRAGAAAVGIRELIFKPNAVEDLCDAVQRLMVAVGDQAGATAPRMTAAGS